jgi:cyclase
VIRSDVRRLVQSFLASFTIFFLFTSPLLAEPKERRVTKLADGVYAIEHKDLNDGNPSGNTTVIIGEREVFVVDSCSRPSSAGEDIAQIRQWTDKPVGYLLNTHFHNDHNNGNKTYLDAFPSLAIIAQEETQKDMGLTQPGNVERQPGEISATILTFRQGQDQSGRTLSEDEKKTSSGTSARIGAGRSGVQDLGIRAPTLTFTDKVDLDLGHREVEVMHLGRGNTSGNAIVYLPREKIIAAGDLLVEPIPYTYDGYPPEWVHTLHRMGEIGLDIDRPRSWSDHA